jgi:hypothetical protein
MLRDWSELIMEINGHSQGRDRIWEDKTILVDTSVSEIFVDDSKTPRIFVSATQQVPWLP